MLKQHLPPVLIVKSIILLSLIISTSLLAQKIRPSAPPDQCVAISAWKNSTENHTASSFAVVWKSKWLICRGDLMHAAIQYYNTTGKDYIYWFIDNCYDLPEVYAYHKFKLSQFPSPPNSDPAWTPFITYDFTGEHIAFVTGDEIWVWAPAVCPKVKVKVRWIR